MTLNSDSTLSLFAQPTITELYSTVHHSPKSGLLYQLCDRFPVGDFHVSTVERQCDRFVPLEAGCELRILPISLSQRLWLQPIWKSSPERSGKCIGTQMRMNGVISRKVARE